MHLALREAEQALEHEDVPIGAVVVREGEVIGTGHNERELRQDPTAHAEILALREAAREVGGWRVLESVLYVTLEPCAMCAGAIVLARVPRVVFGASDPKAGAAGQRAGRPRRAAPEPPARGRRGAAGGRVRSAVERLLRLAALADRLALVRHPGGVAERLNAAVSKTVVRLIGVPRVRISPPPLSHVTSRALWLAGARGCA